MTVSNVLGIIIGVVLVLGGGALLVAWWSMFIVVLMGIIPIFLILIGIGALVYFFSEIKSKSEIEKEKPATSGETKTAEK
jgi:hypothetical protein